MVSVPVPAVPKSKTNTLAYAWPLGRLGPSMGVGWHPKPALPFVDLGIGNCSNPIGTPVGRAFKFKVPVADGPCAPWFWFFSIIEANWWAVLGLGWKMLLPILLLLLVWQTWPPWTMLKCQVGLGLSMTSFETSIEWTSKILEGSGKICALKIQVQGDRRRTCICGDVVQTKTTSLPVPPVPKSKKSNYSGINVAAAAWFGTFKGILVSKIILPIHWPWY